MALTESLNTAAENRRLPAWSSWKNGRPNGYFDLPMTEEARSFFAENGFMVLDEVVTAVEVQALRDEAVRICRGELGEVGGVTAPEPDETDDEIMRKYLCIHFPHKLSSLMKGTLGHHAIVDALTNVISPNVKCMQSMLFIKASGKPGQAWHQDEIYIPTRDRSLAGAWIALDDATVENGCLWVIPGSQKPGVLYLQHWHGDSRFDCALEAQDFPYTNDQAVPVEVKAGSIVFFNGYLLHRSLPNYAAEGFRRSLVNHYMSAESFLPWYGATIPGDQPVSTADNRDITLVAGVDPYAFKGTEDRFGVHVRPSGEGGCGSMKYNEAKLPADQKST